MGIIARNPRASARYLKTVGLRNNAAAFSCRPADKFWHEQEKNLTPSRPGGRGKP